MLEDGWYWVRVPGGRWEVAERRTAFRVTSWWLPDNDDEFSEDKLEIGPRIEPPAD